MSECVGQFGGFGIPLLLSSLVLLRVTHIDLGLLDLGFHQSHAGGLLVSLLALLGAAFLALDPFTLAGRSDGDGLGCKNKSTGLSVLVPGRLLVHPLFGSGSLFIGCATCFLALGLGNFPLGRSTNALESVGNTLFDCLGPRLVLLHELVLGLKLSDRLQAQDVLDWRVVCLLPGSQFGDAPSLVVSLVAGALVLEAPAEEVLDHGDRPLLICYSAFASKHVVKFSVHLLDRWYLAGREDELHSVRILELGARVLPLLDLVLDLLHLRRLVDLFIFIFAVFKPVFVKGIRIRAEVPLIVRVVVGVIRQISGEIHILLSGVASHSH